MLSPPEHDARPQRFRPCVCLSFPDFVVCIILLHLFRYLVACGSTLNVMFNLFRVVGPPVWIPIKWNAGFLALNAMMVVLLMREREEAEQLGKDPEQVSC